jgi:gamma-glutamyltranspeptidase/glutathione hydrolase
MTVQEAVEAPRIWTQGHMLELEAGFPADVFQALADRGHAIAKVGNVAGGMSAIHFHDDGMMQGAACWRADGTPIGVGGGLARAGVRFRPEATRV